MADQDHGHTIAAWTTVLIVVAGFMLGAVAVILLNWPLFWASVGVIVLGGVIGKIMQMMGLGKGHGGAQSTGAAAGGTTADSDG